MRFYVIPQKSPCQPFSLELSSPRVCAQGFDLLGIVSPCPPVRQRCAITHRVSFALLLSFTGLVLRYCEISVQSSRFTQRCHQPQVEGGSEQSKRECGGVAGTVRYDSASRLAGYIA